MQGHSGYSQYIVPGGTRPPPVQPAQAASRSLQMAKCPEKDSETRRQVHTSGLPLPGLHGLGQVQVLCHYVFSISCI